jgi:hypothetical protein
MSGPYIKEKITMDGKIVDLVPTILYLFGLPLGRDMEGEILKKGIKDAFLRDNPVEFIDSWEGKHKRIRLHNRSEVEEKVKDRLRALGYMNETPKDR